MRGAFTERLGIKATALLVSLLLWLAIGARQPAEGFVSVRMEPVLDATLVLAGPAPRLRALVAGRAGDLVRLHASPPVVRRAIGGDAPDTVVLDIVPSDAHVPPDLSADIRVLDIQPRRVTLRLAHRVRPPR